MNTNEDQPSPEHSRPIMLPPTRHSVSKIQPFSGIRFQTSFTKYTESNFDDSTSVATSGGLPALSVYEENEEKLRKEVILGKKIPSLIEIDFMCKSCRICNLPKDSFKTVEDGLKHLRQHFLKRCPKCFVSFSSIGNTFKDHVMTHFFKSTSRPESIQCAFCKEICPYETLWTHMSDSHLEHIRSAGEVTEAKEKVAVNSKCPSFKELTPTSNSKSQQSGSAGPLNGHIHEKTFLLLSTESVLDLCLNPNAPISKQIINSFSTTKSDLRGRKYFTKEQNKMLRSSFLGNPNPNPSWKKRAESLIKDLKCNDYQKTINWFTNVERQCLNGYPPKWVQNAINMPDKEMKKCGAIGNKCQNEYTSARILRKRKKPGDTTHRKVSSLPKIVKSDKISMEKAVFTTTRILRSSKNFNAIDKPLPPIIKDKRQRVNSK